jgi:enoyl-CoA hydratase/carnithine racemase
MLDLRVEGPVATITMESWALLSAHSRAAGTALRDAVLACGDRDDLKAIVIGVSGPVFCALGRPMLAMSDKLDADGWSEVYASSAGVYQALCFSKKVTITAVQGACGPAGSLLVLCSDLTVAAPDAQFFSPFEELPEASLVLAALTMRLGRAKAWALVGDALDAEGALIAGLINRIAGVDVLSDAQALARDVAKMPIDGIAMSKLMMETFLDSQGVGQDFDMAGFYAASLPAGDHA